MKQLIYSPSEKISLKNNPDFNEDWIFERIAENPHILGLGEIAEIKKKEKEKNSFGLKLFLKDIQQNVTYYVFLQLGQNFVHDIYTSLRFWQEEYGRHSHDQKCPVLIGEEFSNSFINQISEIYKGVPIVIIKLSAIKVGNKIVLNFSKIIDSFSFTPVDVVEDESLLLGRDSIHKILPSENLIIADEILKLINENVAGSKFELVQKTRSTFYLHDGTKFIRFIHIIFMKMYLVLAIKIDYFEFPEELQNRLRFLEISFCYYYKTEYLQIKLNYYTFFRTKKLIKEFIDLAVGNYNKWGNNYRLKYK